MVSQGVSMLWSGFIPLKKQQERLGMKMSDLVEHVSKKSIPAWTKNLLVEVMVSDEDDEDVEVSHPGGRDFGLVLMSRYHMCLFTSRFAGLN